MVGTIGRAVALRGEVEVLIVSDDPNRFAPGSVVLRADTMTPLTVSTLRHHGERAIVAFEEVGDRTGAEALRGTDLVVPADQTRSLESDEFWDHDLVGCAVVTVDGTDIGIVTDVLHQPANETLLVDADGKELLVPLVAAVVKSVEPGRLITIDPPPGLFD